MSARAREPNSDAEARARIAEDLDATLVVEAAAGTGKTTALIGRMLAIIGAGRARLEQMVAVTFTEKAAGEMKLRLRGELERAHRESVDGDARSRFETALSELETARIGTIHGFCADLLRERPVQARVDPAFEVIAEDQERALLERAFGRFLSAALEDPPEGVRRLLRRAGRTSSPTEQLRAAAHTLSGQRDFPAAWTRPGLDRRTEIDEVIERLARLAAHAPRASSRSDPLARDLGELAGWLAELSGAEAFAERDHDRLEHELSAVLRKRIWTRSGRGKNFAPDLPREQVLEERAGARSQLEDLVFRLEGDLAALLQQELQPVVHAYGELKAEAGVLDFLDLLLCARDLLRAQPQVRDELRARFAHIFVDEFQDTDPLQAEILLTLATEGEVGLGAGESIWNHLEQARVAPGKLFLVGDPKQSIYAFRRADVTLYARIKDALQAGGAGVVELTRSYRANAALQSAVNASFAPLMQGSEDGSQADYQPLEPVREAPTARPAVIALPVPRPYSQWGNLQNAAIQNSSADAVGAFVDTLIHRSGFTVEEGGAEVPIAARHICLLFRQLRNFGEETPRGYVRALEARRIPHVLVGGRSFHAREEVQALRTALVAIERPDDELSVFATLRGPLLSLSDDALLQMRHDHGRLHPLRPLDEAQLDEATREVATALSLLRQLHLARNRRPIAETIHALLTETRAHAGIAIWPTGEQALANVLRVADQARRFEARGATSFRAFLEQLEKEADRGETGEAPVIEEGTEGVRIMTVHRAKGLEFPVVILCDPTTPRARSLPSRYTDPARGLSVCRLAGAAPLELTQQRESLLAREEAEEVRVAYVAATRARDLLVVPCVGDQPRPGWVDVLHPALYPTPGRERDATPLAGHEGFGGDSVLEAPVRAQRHPQESVKPGVHAPREGTHRGAWWDPAALDRDRLPAGSLRQHELLTEAEDGEAERAGHESHARWQRFRTEALARGRAPTLQARPVTALADELADAEGAESAIEPVEVERTEHAMEASGRPGGARFGTLTHAVLADALETPDAELPALATLHGRLLGATDAEVAAAAKAAASALEHALLVRARASKDCRVETALMLKRGGEVIEGTVDLTFVEQSADGPRWIVIDFKTDADPGSELRYAAQVALYVQAIERATGQPATGILLAV